MPTTQQSTMPTTISSNGEIASLVEQKSQLENSRSGWETALSIALAVTAIAALLIFLFDLKVRRLSGRIEDVQEDIIRAKDRQAVADSQTRDEKIAGAQTDASNALLAQQNVEIELGKQKERTAKAEKAAADAALALEKFKEPRTISLAHQTKFAAAAKPFAGQSFALAVFPDSEAQGLAKVIDGLLRSAGWSRVPSQIQREGGVLMEIDGESAAQISDSGVDVYIGPNDMESVDAQHAICSALLDSGISCENHRTPQLAAKTPRAITIAIGKKP